jgi:hypothetical protein
MRRGLMRCEAEGDSQSPALVPEAVVGAVERERVRVVRVDRVSHKASCRVRVQPDHEEEGKVVRVPALTTAEMALVSEDWTQRAK